MSGEVIRVLDNIRYRRATTTSPQHMNNRLDIHPISYDQKTDNRSCEAYVHRKIEGLLIANFEERAAIREFDGNQSGVEAELGAIEEVIPFLEQINGQERLVIDTTKSSLKYRWWQNGQDLVATLRELGASEETIARYDSQAGDINLR